MRKTALFAMTAAAAITMSGAGFFTSQAAIKGVTVKSYTGSCALTGNNPMKDYSQILGSITGNGTFTVCPDGNFQGIVLPDGMLPDMSVPDNNFPNQNNPGQNNPGQNNPGQNNPGQNNPGQNNPGQDNGNQGENNGSSSSYIKQVVSLVNEERAKAGLAPLTIDTKTEGAAAVRASEIQKSFSHTRPDGRDFSTVLRENGVSYQAAGENIAYGQKSPEEVMQGWMNSSGHRANILSSNFNKIGVGYAQDGNGTGYWVQLFTN